MTHFRCTVHIFTHVVKFISADIKYKVDKPWTTSYSEFCLWLPYSLIQFDCHTKSRFGHTFTDHLASSTTDFSTTDDRGQKTLQLYCFIRNKQSWVEILLFRVLSWSNMQYAVIYLNTLSLIQRKAAVLFRDKFATNRIVSLTNT